MTPTDTTTSTQDKKRPAEFRGQWIDPLSLKLDWSKNTRFVGAGLPDVSDILGDMYAGLGIMYPVEANPTTREVTVGFRRTLAAITYNEQRGAKPGDESYQLLKVTWKAANEIDTLDRNVTENVTRKDYSAIEIAAIGERYLNLGRTQEQIADKLHIDRATLAQLLKLNALPDEIKTLIHIGRLKPAVGIRLFDIDPDKREESLNEALREAAEAAGIEPVTFQTYKSLAIQEHRERLNPPPAPSTTAAPEDVKPAPAESGKGKGKTAAKKTAAALEITDRAVTNAAKNNGGLAPEKTPSLKMKDVLEFLDGVIEAPVSRPGEKQLAEKMKAWCQGKLKPATFQTYWDNLVNDATYSPSAASAAPAKSSKKK